MFEIILFFVLLPFFIQGVILAIGLVGLIFNALFGEK